MSAAKVEDVGGTTIYHVYDASEEELEITRVEFAAPGGGINWWAYALNGSDLYVVTSGEETSLYRVSPGGEPVVVTTLESAGCNVEELMDSGLLGGSMFFIESGRLWHLDLPTNRAMWLENES